MTEEKFKIKRVHCNKCLHETKHFVVGEHSRVVEHVWLNDFNDTPMEETITWTTEFKMLECCGCENVFLLISKCSYEKDLYYEEYYHHKYLDNFQNGLINFLSNGKSYYKKFILHCMRIVGV